MRLALFQMSDSGGMESNIGKSINAIKEAAGQGADLVLLIKMVGFQHKAPLFWFFMLYNFNPSWFSRFAVRWFTINISKDHKSLTCIPIRYSPLFHKSFSFF